MPTHPMSFRNPAGHKGLRGNLTALISSATSFLESRLTLASREAKGAIVRVITLVVCAVAALILMLTGYVFLIVFAIVGVAHLLGISWIWTMLMVALIHFAAALFCLVIARGQTKGALFPETASVLKEDTEWLKNLDQKNRS
ncbi:MAG TPA: phage holin family protein [Chthoniobacterales bacterium]|jgi:uncharacterized membrane protein YqjE|nr:phage holin family protein [Chthoniobacterales bacterium]